MRRVKLHYPRRVLFNLGAAVSFLLVVVIVIASIRSQTGESFQWYYLARRMHAGTEVEIDQRHCIVAINAGRVDVAIGWRDLPPREPRLDPPDDGWEFDHTPWTPRPPPTAPPGVRPDDRFRYWNGFGIYTRAYDDLHQRKRLFRGEPQWQYEQRMREVCVPLWMPGVLASIWPLYWSRWWWIEGRRRRALSAGHCIACGYDLRATPDRCPECGASPFSIDPPAPPRRNALRARFDDARRWRPGVTKGLPVPV